MALTAESRSFQFIRSAVKWKAMTGPDAKNCTPFLKALADPTRWHIVQELLSGPHTVSDLAKRLKVSPSNTSKHLRILREAGIVESARRGKNIHCRISPAFRRSMARNKNQLDLGCCTFRFERKSR